jgi:hypothetical protein
VPSRRSRRAKAAEQKEKAVAEEAAFVAERKKELTRRFAALAAKRLDLEDAERNYHQTDLAVKG